MLYVLVAFPFGKYGGKVYGKLFVADGVFQYAFAYRFKRGYTFLLLLFFTSQYRKLAAEIVVVAMAVESVGKFNRFVLGAVGEYCAYAGVWVCVKFIVRLRGKFLPVVKFFVGALRLFVKRIH